MAKVKDYNKLIETKKEQIMKLIKECEQLADEGNVEFYFAVEYGMGGTYHPKRMTRDEAIRLVSEGAVTDENREAVVEALEGWESSSEQGWVSSSYHC